MQEKKKEQTRLVALVIGCVMCMSAGCYFAASMSNETTNQQGLPGEQTPLPSAVADYMLDRNNTWTYPGASINQPRAITASYGGYFFTTSLVMRSGYYVTLAKWDEFGGLVWNRTWYSPYICEVRDVHYLDRPNAFEDEVWVIGNYYPTGISYMNIFWLKYSFNGTFTWQRVPTTMEPIAASRCGGIPTRGRPSATS
jgi:hypothetical protein